MLINYVCRGMGNRCLSAALFISKRFQPAPKDGRRYKQKKKSLNGVSWKPTEAASFNWFFNSQFFHFGTSRDCARTTSPPGGTWAFIAIRSELMVINARKKLWINDYSNLCCLSFHWAPCDLFVLIIFSLPGPRRRQRRNSVDRNAPQRPPTQNKMIRARASFRERILSNQPPGG